MRDFLIVAILVLSAIAITAGGVLAYFAITDIRHSRIRRNKNAK
jgi:hypothetical protein